MRVGETILMFAVSNYVSLLFCVSRYLQNIHVRGGFAF